MPESNTVDGGTYLHLPRNLRGGTRDGSSTRSRSDPALGAAQEEAGARGPRGTRDSMQQAEEIRGQPRYARGSE